MDEEKKYLLAVIQLYEYIFVTLFPDQKMTVSNPPQSRGHVEAVGEANSPPAPRRDESPRDTTQQTEAGGDPAGGPSGPATGGGRVSSPAVTTAAGETPTAAEVKAATETSEASNEIVVEGSEPIPDPEALIAAFPFAKLTKLEELIHNPRWVIPVLPKGELEVLLETSITLARAKADKRCIYKVSSILFFCKMLGCQNNALRSDFCNLFVFK